MCPCNSMKNNNLCCFITYIWFFCIPINLLLWPIFGLVSMCYYSSKPEIHITLTKITECPRCLDGLSFICYSFIVDGTCSDASPDLFICEKCLTVYPEDKLGYYYAPFTSFRDKWASERAEYESSGY